ncbi:DUF1289 domain-containing protein [Rhodalgimonas zhirmunskyi]|uniref:DUF1289 domain-containing protein n=1 Tax=Rhodalgimonas zhirmunskyi TaxID=2964767 RepID=A0AAJ1X6D9_9RHOB|nr:DUF1289 domain-containing protein [Rhodoalgimonas zhirmunskyi]MDQ2093322.1 DUF1289 domain-containing protein [Rhodoalgimonas zhirmunskyi]
MSDDIWRREPIESPCVKICVMHEETGICTGCYRTRDEIAGWMRKSPEERREIMGALPERAQLLKKRRGGRAGRLSRQG